MTNTKGLREAKGRSKAVARINDSKLNQKLMQNVKVSDSGCWEWQKARNPKGYGLSCYKNKSIFAHRLSYAAFKGSIEATQLVCHHCDNPCCINPDHLFAGTWSDNMRDHSAKGRHYLQRDPERGRKILAQCEQLRGERHGRSKLTEEQVIEIKKTGKFGKHGNVAMLAEKYGICRASLRDILNGINWKHVVVEGAK